MPKGYWIAHLTITDPEMQQKYVAADKIAFDKYGGKYIVRGGPVPPGFPNASRCEIMQGTFKKRHVVIEFRPTNRRSRVTGLPSTRTQSRTGTRAATSISS